MPVRRLSHSSALLTLAAATTLAVFPLTGCSKRYTWNPEKPPESTDSEVKGKHIVLFAPVALTDSIDADQPTAKLDIAYDLAAKIAAPGISAWVGETLPDGADPSWPPLSDKPQDLPAAANGAHIVVTGKVTHIHHQTDGETAGKPMAIASVELTAWDATGTPWTKKEQGRAELEVPAKQPLLNPDRKASWNAFAKAAKALKLHLDGKGDPINTPTIGTVVEPAQPVAAAGLVTVLVDSTPQGADIEINGRYRGNTPAKVPMPAREITLTIKLAGHQTWERTLVPEAGLPIKPTLQPLEK